MIDYAQYARRAREQSNQADDYWDKAATFLSQLAFDPAMPLTVKQRNWKHGLMQDLKSPWESD